MTTLLLIGEYEVLNAIAASQSVSSTDADTGFPLANVRDGEPGSLFRFSTTATNLEITADLSVIKNSGYENWGTPAVPDDWLDESSGTGALSEETTLFDAGASALKMTAGGAGNEARCRQRRLFEPGSTASVSVRLRGDGTNSVSAYLKNEQTGKYLQSGGTWTATRTAFGSESGTSYATKSVLAFAIEAASVSETGVVELRFETEQVTGSGYADEFHCWPAWTFSGVFGHDLEDDLTVKVRSDDNVAFSSPTDQITFTNRRRPSFFGTVSQVTERWAQLRIEGEKSRPPSIGEWVVGRHSSLSRAIDLPMALTPRVNLFGSLVPASVQREEALEFPAAFRLTESLWDELRYTMMGAGRWGGTRAVLVPLDTRADVYFGTLTIERVDRERPGNIYQVDGIFREMNHAARVR